MEIHRRFFCLWRPKPQFWLWRRNFGSDWDFGHDIGALISAPTVTLASTMAPQSWFRQGYWPRQRRRNFGWNREFGLDINTAIMSLVFLASNMILASCSVVRSALLSASGSVASCTTLRNQIWLSCTMQSCRYLFRCQLCSQQFQSSTVLFLMIAIQCRRKLSVCLKLRCQTSAMFVSDVV